MGSYRGEDGGGPTTFCGGNSMPTDMEAEIRSYSPYGVLTPLVGLSTLPFLE